MKTVSILVDFDMAYREELTSRVSEADIKSVFELRYGRGWQRKLGQVLDVPETTVNGWVRSGKFPALAKLAFGVLLSQNTRPPQKWLPVKSETGYAVYDFQGPVGQIVADNIPRLADASLIAAAPLLYEGAGEACVIFDDARDSFEGWGELADKLRAGLDAAVPVRSGDADEADQEEDR